MLMMKKEEFYYNSRDGVTKIHAMRWIPDTEKIKGVIQIVHGMSEHIGRYEPLAAFFAASGFVVVGEDHLGHGLSISQDGMQGYFCEDNPASVVVNDVHRLRKITQKQFGNAPYFILGHSMGSFIVRNYITRYGKGLCGAIVLGTGLQSDLFLYSGRIMTRLVGLFKGQKHVSRFLDFCVFGSYNRRIHPVRTKYDWLTKDAQYVDDYLADENCGFIFTVNGFMTLSELIRRIKLPKNMRKVPKELPIYIASGTEDPVGDYGKGVKKSYSLYQKYGVKDITLRLYEGDRHELQNETDRELFMKELLVWVEDRVMFS